MVIAIAAVLIALYGISTLGFIYLIGKPRKPVTHGVAIWATIYNMLYVCGILYLAVN